MEVSYKNGKYKIRRGLITRTFSSYMAAKDYIDNPGPGTVRIALGTIVAGGLIAGLMIAYMAGVPAEKW